jgi:predicted MFS family arabinose efflux permease
METTSPALTRRLRPLKIAMLLHGVALWVPVEKLFMTQIGFDAALVAVMAAAYAAVVPIMEIPSGILADRWTRRGVLVLAAVAATASVLVGALSHNVTSYIVCAMILGAYFALQSGTLEALVYDTVVEETGDSETFERHLGRIQALNSAALVVSALAGGWIASVASPRFTYFATLPFVAASVVALLRFREPRLHKAAARAGMREHVVTTARAMLGGGRLLPIVVVMALGSLLLQSVFEFGPLWLIALGASAALFGPATAGLLSALGLGGLLAGRLSLARTWTRRVVVAVMAVCSVVLVVGWNVWLIICAQVVLALLLVTLGIHLTRLLHDEIPSAVRSSVASGVSTLSWVAFLPFALAFGAVSQSYGVHAAGWLYVTLTLLLGVLLSRASASRRASATARVPAACVPQLGLSLAAAA